MQESKVSPNASGVYACERLKSSSVQTACMHKSVSVNGEVQYTDITHKQQGSRRGCLVEGRGNFIVDLATGSRYNWLL